MSVARLRSWLAALPEVEERETWGHPTFRVRDRMFGTLDVEARRMSIKAAREEQAALLDADPTAYYLPAYVARHGWIGVVLRRADPIEVHELVVEAWRRTAPVRVVRAWQDRDTVS